jgi:hypothetical protein
VSVCHSPNAQRRQAHNTRTNVKCLGVGAVNVEATACDVRGTSRSGVFTSVESGPQGGQVRFEGGQNPHTFEKHQIHFAR